MLTYGANHPRGECDVSHVLNEAVRPALPFCGGTSPAGSISIGLPAPVELHPSCRIRSLKLTVNIGAVYFRRSPPVQLSSAFYFYKLFGILPPPSSHLLVNDQLRCSFEQDASTRAWSDRPGTATDCISINTARAFTSRLCSTSINPGSPTRWNSITYA